MKALSHLPVLFLIFLAFPAFGQIILFVDHNATSGDQNGSSWADAYTDLNGALSAANPGDHIWVAQGIYRPTSGTDRNARFELPNAVTLLGGFDGTEFSEADRDWEANPTILSGDIGVVGDSADNSFTILYMEYVDSNTVVDGLVFMDGHAQSEDGDIINTEPEKSGGAIYIHAKNGAAHPKVRNCFFENNSAFFNGGAVFANGLINGDMGPQFSNCIFQNNAAGEDGGGMYIDGNSVEEVKANIFQCQFIENYSVKAGGGLAVRETSGLDTLEIVDCTFYSNVANTHGGGMTVLNGRFEGSKISVRNCYFEENSALEGGAFTSYNSVYVETDFIEIDNCEFLYNISTEHGGAAIAIDGLSFISTPIFHLKHSLFLGQTSEGSPSVIDVNLEFGHIDIEGCIFDSNSANYTNHLGLSGSVIGVSGIDATVSINQCAFKNHDFFSRIIHSNLPYSISQCLFINNKIIKNGIIGGGGSFSNCVFKNDIQSSYPNFFGDPIDVYNSIFYEGLGDTLSVASTDVTLHNCFISVPDCSSLPDVYTCGPGNIFGTDPMFLDTANGDYRLHPCSPARNAGDNAILSQFDISTDLSGGPRILEGTVDMGAYETPEYEVALDSILPVGCGGESTGGFAVSVAQGCAPFTVDFGGVSTVADTTPFVLTGFPAGPYGLTIIDAQGREMPLDFEIEQPPMLSVQATASDVDCEEGLGGVAIVAISGGTGSTGIGWGNGATGPSLAGLLPGSYPVTVTDAAGCTAVDTAVVGLSGSITISGLAGGVTCHGLADGTATALPESGTAPFTYLWEGGATDSVIMGLPGGSYAVTLTDAIGCTGDTLLLVQEPDSIFLEILAPASPLCFGAENGWLAPVVDGGTPGYFFGWENGSMDSLLAALPQGEYPLTVTDANGCTATAIAMLTASPEILADATVAHATGATTADGAIEVAAVEGGAPGYTFEWSNGATTQSIQDLLPGNYSLTVTDADGCQQVFDFTVEVEVATVQVLGGAQLDVFPNPVPAGGSLWLRLEPAPAQILGAQLFDALGRVVFRENIAAGEDLYYFKMPEIRGVYILVLRNAAGGRAAFRVMVE